jgi:hypothetical protein
MVRIDFVNITNDMILGLQFTAYGTYDPIVAEEPPPDRRNIASALTAPTITCEVRASAGGGSLQTATASVDDVANTWQADFNLPPSAVGTGRAMIAHMMGPPKDSTEMTNIEIKSNSLIDIKIDPAPTGGGSGFVQAILNFLSFRWLTGATLAGKIKKKHKGKGDTLHKSTAYSKFDSLILYCGVKLDTQPKAKITFNDLARRWEVDHDLAGHGGKHVSHVVEATFTFNAKNHKIVVARTDLEVET